MKNHVSAGRRSNSRQKVPIFYAASIFLSAFLLFLVQPVIAKEILPWFGGAASVWTTCLVFFQVSLLVGYAYSDLVTRKLALPAQVRLHTVLLVVSLLSLPIIPAIGWRPTGGENPSLLILGMLAATIGAPYVLLSTTTPIVQSWLIKARPGSNPYRLFALSNTGSMLALVGYPFLLEPWVVTRGQALGWSAGYVIFTGLCIATGWASLRQAGLLSRRASETAGVSGANPDPASETAVPSEGSSQETLPRSTTTAHATRAVVTESPPTTAEQLRWGTLAGLGVVLLLAVTNRITQDIVSVPLLWILPLALYLATFIICFDHPQWYRRGAILLLLAVAVPAMGWMLVGSGVQGEYHVQIAVFSIGLFVACMFCHGELVLSKPAPAYLTRFYLLVAVGGAVGSVLVGIVAPLVLPGYFELEAGLVAVGLLLLWQVRRDSIVFRSFAVAVVIAAVALGGLSIREFYDETVSASRNFYGVLRVQETGTLEFQNRSLVHGGIRHGTQYRGFPTTPTTYYVPTSGIGKLLSLRPQTPLRIGLVGLGTGTMAAYGMPGDVMRYYEIDSAVVEVAQHDFTFLHFSKAKVEIVLGDARLSLESEPDQGFDLLVIDAFFGDAIPVHLLTVEAMALYKRHLKPGGILALHVSNRFLNLIPVVVSVAGASNLYAAHVRDTTSVEPAAPSDWVLLSERRETFNLTRVADLGQEVQPLPRQRPWTDDYNSLLQALK